MTHYWDILWNHDRPLRLVAARLLMATGLCRFLNIRQAAFRLKFHPANLPFQLWINPSERDESLLFYHAYLKPGDRVVDVGANIGQTVLTSVTQVGTEGHVIAIEAHPRTFGFLQDNLRINRVSNVTAINSAAGDRSGIIRFSDDRRDDMNRVDGGALEVTVARLDELVPDTAPVNLLKVDVEGYEKFVLEGATELLKRTDCVLLEVSSLHFARFGYTTRDLLELIVAAGFQPYRLTAENSIMKIGVDFDTPRHEDILALRDRADCLARTGWCVTSS